MQRTCLCTLVRLFPLGSFLEMKLVGQRIQIFSINTENYTSKDFNNYTPIYSMQDGICKVWKCLSLWCNFSTWEIFKIDCSYNFLLIIGEA